MQTLEKHFMTEQEVEALGNTLAPHLPPEFLMFLYGPLGAGKTTFVRSLLRGLGYLGKVKSPTYTLVEPYEIGDLKIFHFDLYRLQNADELMHMGITDYFSQAAISFIEWPEKGLSCLPQPDLACYISQAKEGRDLRFVAYTPRGASTLKCL